MYTQCPECQTVFRVSEEQLALASGKVRCGRCLEVFPARDHAVEELPGVSTSSARPAHDRSPVEDNTPWEPRPAGAPISRRADPWPDSDRESAAETERRIESLLSAAPSASEEAAASDSIEPAAGRTQTRPGNGADFPLSDAASSAIAEDHERPGNRHPQPSVPAPSAAPDEAAPRKASPPRPRAQEETDDSIDRQAALHFSAQDGRTPDDGGTEPPLPAALRQPERRGAGPLAVIFWSFASLLMLAVLVAQYGYYERYELVKNPAVRPWLERMCVYLDCRLPPRRDASAFELQERDVRYHPEYAGALLISGTFVNTASFAQPHPSVEVLLKDLNGKIVASRRFAPADYLQHPITGPDLLSPGTEARLLLEVSDPGNQAVSFEFNFL